jgi:dTDP-4-amino-4,6-dideoxygalactose transaminase
MTSDTDRADSNSTAGPSVRAPLLVGRPNLGNRERLMHRIGEMLDRHWFSNNGPLVQEFEAALAAYVGVRHCVTMCNATIAMEIAARALDLSGEVIVPAYTFVATAHAFRWQEITPVFADMNPRSHNIDPASIERLITPKTSAIVGTHVWGRACDVDAISAIAARHGLKVMFDAAHAFGCSHQGRMIGGFGACEVFSFHATKFLNSFEGGAVATNDDQLAERMRLMRNFGFSGFDNVIHLGTNGKMTEVCAAMGLTSLEAIDELVEVNRRNYVAYQQGLYGVPGVSLLEYDPKERNNYQYIVVEIDPDICPVTRDELVERLHARGVIARKYFWPGVHRMHPYRAEQPNARMLLPNTERIAQRVIVLPTGQQMAPTDVHRACDVFRDSLSLRRSTNES